tara:strand:+ start:335 stop:565 length:231 start_codon:yes stop_codon:yes gene_type:complete
MDNDAIKDVIVKNPYLWIIVKNGETWEQTRVIFQNYSIPMGLKPGTQWCYYEELDEKSLENNKIVFKEGKSPHIVN